MKIDLTKLAKDVEKGNSTTFNVDTRISVAADIPYTPNLSSDLGPIATLLHSRSIKYSLSAGSGQADGSTMQYAVIVFKPDHLKTTEEREEEEDLIIAEGESFTPARAMCAAFIRYLRWMQGMGITALVAETVDLSGSQAEVGNDPVAGRA